MLKFNRREFTRVLAGSGGIGLFSVATEAESGKVSESKPGPGSITDVQGVRVGHYTDSRRPTGCTATLFDNEVSAGVDYDGSAPGYFSDPPPPAETILTLQHPVRGLPNGASRAHHETRENSITLRCSTYPVLPSGTGARH